MDRPGRVPVEQAYIAHLWAYGKVVGRGSARGGLPGARFLLALPAEGGEGAFLPLPAKHRGLALRSFLGRPVHAHFWPRTDGEGLLREAALVHIFPLEDPPPGLSRPTFLVRGRLLGVEREGGRVAVEVRPNPKGRLKEPFTLVLWAPLSLLEGLPPVGSGVYVEGEARLKTRRLVAKKVEPARLWDDPS